MGRLVGFEPKAAFLAFIYNIPLFGRLRFRVRSQFSWPTTGTRPPPGSRFPSRILADFRGLENDAEETFRFFIFPHAFIACNGKAIRLRGGMC